MNDKGAQISDPEMSATGMTGRWQGLGAVFLWLASVGAVCAVIETLPIGRPWSGVSYFAGNLLYGLNLHLAVAALVAWGGRLILWPAKPRWLFVVCAGFFLCFELGLVGGYWLSRMPLMPEFYTGLGKIVTAACLGGGVILGLLIVFVIVRRQWHQRWLNCSAGRGLAGLLLSALLLIGNVIGVISARPDGAAPVSGENEGEVKQENVFVILIDTLRRDHLSYFDYPRPTSANIDKLFSESWVFTRAYTPSSWTIPSVTSLLAGIYPSSHNVLTNFSRVPDEAVMVAEHFRRYGYRTGAFISNRLVNGGSGFAQGFEHFKPTPPQFWMLHRHTAVEQIVLKLLQAREQNRGWKLNQQVLSWLQESPAEPHFVYMHFMEPHSPYDPPQSDREAVAPGVPAGRTEPPMIENYREQLQEMGCHDWECVDPKPELTDEEMVGLVANYDGEIHLMDRRIGTLMDELKAMGLYENSHIIFCVDHGEEFGDHGGWFHVNSIYEEMTGCALSYRQPGGFESPREIDRAISLMDIVPTLCRRLGMDIPPMHQGSLIPELLGGEAPANRQPVLSELPPYLYSLRLGSWKLIQRGELDSPVWRLFDMDRDPREQFDLAEVYPDTLAFMKGYLEGVRARYARTSLSEVTNRADPELLRQLRNLGYIQ